MSLNLHCEEVALWQTPTWITEIIMSDMDGGWKGVLKRYQIWVKSHAQGSFKTTEDLRVIQEWIADHLKEVGEAVKKNKKLNFSIR